MARIPLIHIPDGLYSVVSKCNNDEFLFDAEEKFDLYLKHLLHCKKKLGFTLYDIVCMSNHVHELYRVPKNGFTIADILQAVKGHFALKFNKIFERSGHFWRNKPFYRIVEDKEYAFNTCRYYHFNPVRAKMVNHPSKWPYSGYRFHVMNRKSDLLGKLLDEIPGVDYSTRTDDKYPRTYDCAVDLLQQKRQRFIGSIGFIQKMKKKYSR
ncbi:MAG: transposase [Pseudomonadota bacterium]